MLPERLRVAPVGKDAMRRRLASDDPKDARNDAPEHGLLPRE
jgi:hypothetical protein